MDTFRGKAFVVRRRAPMRKSAQIAVDEQRLFVDGDEVAWDAAAFARRTDAPNIVSLLDPFERPLLDIYVDGPEDAEALVHALGLDEDRSMAAFRIASPIAGALTVASLVALVAAFGAAHAGSGVLIAACLATVAAAMALGRAGEARIGYDGVYVRSLGFARFLAWPDLVAAERRNDAVILRVRGARETRITLLSPRAHRFEERFRAAERAFHEARSRVDRRAAATVPTARAGRTLAEWTRAMIALRAPSAEAYRAAEVTADRLFSIVEDPAADPSARVGAAMALAPNEGPAGVARLRSAARFSAHPVARRGIVRAAQGNDTR